MLTGIEVISAIAAMIGVAVLAFFLQKFVGGVEENMNEMRVNERDSSPVVPAKPVRHMDPRRKRR